MIMSILCYYSDAYTLVKEIITVPYKAAEVAEVNTNKKVTFQNCPPFTSCITKIDNRLVEYVEDTDIVMPMHNLIEYGNGYSETSGSLWQYYRDEPLLNNNNIVDFLANDNDTNSFKLKQQITRQVGNASVKDNEIMVPLKYLSNFLGTLETYLINCSISLQ